MTEKIWANSGDSHFLEPETLWRDTLPPRLAELVPYTERDADGQWETVHIDGMSFRRLLPTGKKKEFYEASSRAPGARDIGKRMIDLDQEGIWAELVFPSLGMWSSTFRSPEVLREALKVSNDWAFDPQQEDYNQDVWEPFWAAAEAARIVIAFHIGTDPIDFRKGAAPGIAYRGPGGAVLNYTDTTFGGQRAVMKLVASGALDRHPDLRVLVSEGGATWVPFVADRMEEGYRQHAMAVRPKLSRSPKEIIYSQVYASFQHDESAVAACTAMGFTNVLWGSDYPHMEGTYGHTQETLHHLFDGVDPAARHRITVGAFQELFPGTPPLPTPAAA
jgi:hypothetical protein